MLGKNRTSAGKNAREYRPGFHGIFLSNKVRTGNCAGCVMPYGLHDSGSRKAVAELIAQPFRRS